MKDELAWRNKHIKIYMSLFSSKGVTASVVLRETDRDKRRRLHAAILTDNFFLTTLSFHIHIQGSIKHFSAREGGGSTGGPLWSAALAGHPVTRRHPPWLTESLLATSWNWLKTDCISRGNLHIWFHNTNTFPFNQVTTSAYLHRCVMYRKISDWRLGQGSICNTYNYIIEYELVLDRNTWNHMRANYLY